MLKKKKRMYLNDLKPPCKSGASIEKFKPETPNYHLKENWCEFTPDR